MVTGDTTGGWTPFAELVATDASGWTAPLVADDDPIRLMYTSGTESRPKGALLTSRALQAEYLSAIIDGGVKIVETAGNNPQKWLPRLKDAGIHVVDIHELKELAEKITGTPTPLPPAGRTIAKVMRRDGGILDTIGLRKEEA